MMMRNALSAILLLLALTPSAQTQARRPPYGLPAGALVIEKRMLELGSTKKRALVLWMLRPKRYPRETPDEPYTCPEETRGSYYRGPARVSLVDTATGRVVNTLKLIEEDADGADEIDIPYRIHAGGYYRVEGVPEGREGRPTLLWLRDFNGDGKAYEFALFDAEACMGLETALFGYSERQDRVIQYPVSLVTTDDKGKKSTEMLKWIDYLFSKEPTAPGHWKFAIDYRGRGGSLDSYEVHYNDAAERFEGTASYTGGQQ
ncbi:MAG: hypothetical protein QOH49_3282 [Acidobacteriota bacterium]|jgi:hypothetical protein|nr:hypothetical protein [Acidobacteriota bacterium]